ncbi:MAG: hypothetical protein HOQ29_15245 [Acidobacteria bacterium]|nr:hypothetical protein [Acidobacteriota bacterium]
MSLSRYEPLAGTGAVAAGLGRRRTAAPPDRSRRVKTIANWTRAFHAGAR